MAEYQDGRQIIVRKGLSKFNDIYLEFLDERRYQDPKDRRAVRDYTLGPIFEALN